METLRVGRSTSAEKVSNGGGRDRNLHKMWAAENTSKFWIPTMESVDVGFLRSIREYKKYSPLCFTHFSQVYLVQDTIHQQRCVMKIVPGPHDCSHISYEVFITRQLNHPYVIRALDGFEWQSFYCLVFERFTGGSLADALRSRKFRSFAKIGLVMFRCLLAIDYLHRRQIIHGDISPNNILFKGDTPILIDFGASEILIEGGSGVIRIGTDPFTAPEKRSKQITLAADVYSLGATFCYFIEGNTTLEMCGGGWSGAPASLRKLIEGMMELSPSSRPSPAECIGHSFFAEVLDSGVLEEELERHAEFNC
jgi:serine/threonine protein kinase